MTKNNPKRQTLIQLFRFLKPYSLQYVLALIVLGALFTSERTVAAFMVKMFVDGITSNDLDRIFLTVRTWFIFFVIYVPMILIFIYWWRGTVYKVVANLRQTIFSYLQRLPLGYVEGRHSGDLISVLTNDVTTAEQAFQQDLMTLVNASLQGLSATIIMLFIEWRLALVVVGAGFIPLIINALFAPHLRKAGDAVQEQLGGVSERLADLLGGFTVVRTFNLGEWILERFDRSNSSLLAAEMHRVRLEAALAAANNFGGSSFFISFGVGAYMVLNGMTTFGSMFALVQLNNQIQYFVFSLGGTMTRIQAALAAADRILNVLETPQEFERYQPIAEKTIAEPDPAALLEFQQVRFRYDESKEVLQDLSFSVGENQVAAIVGPSGGGKSTIFKLLLGCYPVRHGSLLLDGRSINVLSLPELRDQFAYIPQDAYLYSGTIQDNIRFGKPEATNEEITAAAKAAYAHDFITSFKDGYNTRVGERGARLSGGQRQRIAIARALLKDARILLLDEATSALDSESEELVQRALKVLMRGRTVLVIAHRLSTIENADIIYTIDEGRLVESGDHQTLIAQGGLYRRLYELQFQGDEVPA